MRLQVPIALLREAVSYDKNTGVLTWIGVNIRMLGKRAGCPSGRYRKVCIAGTRVFEHRAIWALVHGTWPENEIDHINRDGHDNSLANLRAATRSQNCANRGTLKTNVLGSACVRRSRGGRFEARIGVEGRRVYLGTFDDLQTAESAVLTAKASTGRLK